MFIIIRNKMQISERKPGNSNQEGGCLMVNGEWLMVNCLNQDFWDFRIFRIGLKIPSYFLRFKS